MKAIFGLIFGVMVGALITFGIVNVNAHLSKPSYIPDEFNYLDLFRLSLVKIPKEQYHCESNMGNMGNRVGDVLGFILRSNANYYLNKINESCSGEFCEISHSNCAPWQNDGCGSTILSFNVARSGTIDINSFQCLQMP